MSLDLMGGNGAKLLTANDAALTLDYNLLTFGEEGFTSAGKVTVEPGTLEVPAGQLPVNDEHISDKPVGYMTAADAGGNLTASVSFFHTKEGRAAYEDAKTGKRKGISVEVENPVVKAGKLLAGLLCGSGIVKRPAFASSLLLASYSEDAEGTVTMEAVSAEAVNEADTELDAARAAIDAGDLDAAQAAITAAQDKLTNSEESEEEEEETIVPKPALTASSANPQAALRALLAGVGAAPEPAEPEVSLAKFTAGYRDAIKMDSKLKASHLETMTQTDLYDPAVVPAYLGELWRKSPYTEIWTDIVAKEGLTALTYKGYRWMEGDDAEALGLDGEPIVDDWEPAFIDREDSEDGSAHMQPIPTSALRLEGKDFHARRIAGGNRFDRALLDFPVPGVMESFLYLQTEHIKKRRDFRTREAVLAQAARGMLKTGFTTRDTENAFRRIIVGAMHVMEYDRPTYAVVGNDIYRDMLGTDMLENLALLEKSLGLDGGTMSGFKIKPARITDTEMNGRVIVGVDKSVVLHEPAGAPIRVDAQELAVGAVDKAVFSYYMLRSDDRGGVVEVPAA